MTKRIFRAICLVMVLAIVASLLVTMSVMYHYFTVHQQDQLRTQIELAAQGVKTQGEAYFDGLQTEHCRITWIDSDGKVLFDTQTDHVQMENHLQREEVFEALQIGYGESTRYSDTLLMRSLYAASKLEDGTVIRVSITQDTVLRLMGVTALLKKLVAELI